MMEILFVCAILVSFLFCIASGAHFIQATDGWPDRPANQHHLGLAKTFVKFALCAAAVSTTVAAVDSGNGSGMLLISGAIVMANSGILIMLSRTDEATRCLELEYCRQKTEERHVS